MQDGQVRGPALPRFVPLGSEKGVRWHPMTRRWWENWRRSPQAIRMSTGPDWDFLLETAVLHHRYWSGEVSTALSAELRIRQAKFGVTAEDRSRLGVEVGVPVPTGEPRASESPFEPDEPANGNVSSIEERRARLARIEAREASEAAAGRLQRFDPDAARAKKES